MSQEETTNDSRLDNLHYRVPEQQLNHQSSHHNQSHHSS